MFALALSSTTVLLVYAFDLPTLLTGCHQLVTEYYYANALGSLLLDLGLVFAYLEVAGVVIANLNAKSIASRTAVVAVATGLISSAFYFLFSSGFQSGSFFSRWFAAAGFRAVAYDMVLVTCIYLVFVALYLHLERRLAADSVTSCSAGGKLKY